MKFPKYADWRERTGAEPSTLLTATQTRQLLKAVVKEFGDKESPYLKLRELLLKDGWGVVEKHGDRLFMRVVIVYGETTKQDVERFVKQAGATGNWSYSDWLNAQKKPSLKIVK